MTTDYADLTDWQSTVYAPLKGFVLISAAKAAIHPWRDRLDHDMEE